MEGRALSSPLVPMKMDRENICCSDLVTAVFLVVLGELRDKCISLAERYTPVMFTIPVDVGFRWLPQWSSSPVRSVTSGKSRKLWTPLHRMEFSQFAFKR
ncbi:hypothetical protein ACOSQ2_023106 [Xanthoceras sorbifolium]